MGLAYYNHPALSGELRGEMTNEEATVHWLLTTGHSLPRKDTRPRGPVSARINHVLALLTPPPLLT